MLKRMVTHGSFLPTTAKGIPNLWLDLEKIILNTELTDLLKKRLEKVNLPNFDLADFGEDGFDSVLMISKKTFN